MKRINVIFALLVMVLFTASCSANHAIAVKPYMTLFGSTAAGAEIKRALSIEAEKRVDFIRWDLGLDHSGTFGLTINFGEGEPNTPGFKGGGEFKKIAGKYSVVKEANGEVFQFTSESMPVPISLRRIDENVFHVLTDDKTLMSGTGGWGYSLTRKGGTGKATRPLVSSSASLLGDRELETVFVGRTPCVDLGRRDLPFAEGCLKLKWKLTLYRNAAGRPTAYKIESTLNRTQAVEGKWSLVNGTHANPSALILQLDPDMPEKTVSFLVGDENVLFFLSKDHRVLAGNADFGFSLSRWIKGVESH